jgi:two-component system, OmpR family, response regulator ChvI
MPIGAAGPTARNIGGMGGIMNNLVTLVESESTTDALLRVRDMPAVPRARVVVVDDDDLVRQTIVAHLSDADFEVRGFASGAATLAHLGGGARADVVLLDWKMPGMSGMDVLRRMREAGIWIPVIFLTALTDPALEERAFDGGAVDFVEKARSFTILRQRINLILNGAKPQKQADKSLVTDAEPLELRRDVYLALWKRQEVPLTLTEFRLLDLLVSHANEHVSYRALYDVVHGKDFIAGAGDDGFRANVRTFIKRIRRKFRDIDSDWEMIQNYAGFGYRWVMRDDRSDRDAT